MGAVYWIRGADYSCAMDKNHLPSLFVSHGAPTFALDPGVSGRQLRAVANQLPRPRAILIISPHWMTRSEIRITGSARPDTIHDFGGFDPELYKIHYSAPGDPVLARRVATLLTENGWQALVDPTRGLDHGAWVPLLYLYPEADIPVLQVSMPQNLDAQTAFQMGNALAPLADEGILIIGSGSLTHNLYELGQFADGEARYAREFTEWIREGIQTGNVQRLLGALETAPHARRAHPTTEHFLPLPVALGAATRTDRATVLDGGTRYGVLAMESYVLGTDLELEDIRP